LFLSSTSQQAAKPKRGIENLPRIAFFFRATTKFPDKSKRGWRFRVWFLYLSFADCGSSSASQPASASLSSSSQNPGVFG
jgi:hypothetical protein